jgi:hypothetical protein
MNGLIPEHLGGHVNQTHIDSGVLTYMQETFNVTSMLDIGCALGYQVMVAQRFGMSAYGVDGDFTVIPQTDNFTVHDYQEGSAPLGDLEVDMIWSCEFVEHVYEEYLPNFVKDFQRGKYLVMTYSDHENGHHHVNVKPQSYWEDTISSYGFEFDAEETAKIREVSTMNLDKPQKKRFVQNTGMFFRRV